MGGYGYKIHPTPSPKQDIRQHYPLNLSFVLFVILFFLHLLIIVRECFTLEKGCKEVSLDEGAHFSKLLDSSGFCSWF